MKYNFLKIGLLLTFIGSCASDPAKRIEEADIHFRISQQLALKNETIQALAEAQKASKLNPNQPEIQNFLGLLYLQKNMKKEAEEQFQRAIKINPTYSEAQNHLCGLYVDMGRYDEGLKHCHKAVENVLYGTPERAYHNMGWAFEKRGEIEKAKEMYQKGLLHNEKFVLSLKSLGKLFYNEKEFLKAQKNFEKAAGVCRLSPKGAWGQECTETYFQLAMTYIQIRQRGKALQSFQDCVKDPFPEDSEYVQKCRKSLQIYK